ncbi:PQ loop repeat protein [Coccidioides posadasii str. Silveira]|uniref:PQ loop repeat protein n=1 Tax=Coccidioides posadasii (strain RMSCC 757 / Silveira) TaxID=443226 RepID=E9DI11_COCPS|nr:PQ loop repeat protein [Coccidioides posadasii str. Silveira]
MVHPARTSNMVQLEEEKHGWPASVHDAPMGPMCSSIRYLYDSTRCQYTYSNSTADLWDIVLNMLGADSCLSPATVITLALAVLLGGSEVLFILTLRIPYRKGITWPALLFGILATILLVLGLMSPYQEIWKRRGRVVGINWVFLTIDTFGALFSLLALVVESSFDVLGGVMYCVVLALEIGIFGSHIVWRLLHRDLLKEAKAAGVTIDEILEANKRTVTPSSLVESQDHVGVATVDTVEQARR